MAFSNITGRTKQISVVEDGFEHTEIAKSATLSLTHDINNCVSTNSKVFKNPEKNVKVFCKNNEHQSATEMSEDKCVLTFIESVIHSRICEEKFDCPTHNENCSRMKPYIFHTRRCKKRKSGVCNVCKKILEVCRGHVLQCTDSKCRINCCDRAKHIFGEEQRVELRKQQEKVYEVTKKRLEAARATYNDAIQRIEHSTMRHIKRCTRNLSGDCEFCRNLVSSGYCSPQFNDDGRHCNMMFTNSVKVKLKQQQLQPQMMLKMNLNTVMVQRWNAKHIRFGTNIVDKLKKMQECILSGTKFNTEEPNLIKNTIDTAAAETSTFTTAEKDIKGWQHTLCVKERSQSIEKLTAAMMPLPANPAIIEEVEDEAKRRELEVYESASSYKGYKQEIAKRIYETRVDKYKKRKILNDERERDSIYDMI